MSEFKKGDKVKSKWGDLQTVEHASPDGKCLWLVDSDGDYSTYDAESWTVVPKFFEAGKIYTSSFGTAIYIHHATFSLDGSLLALAENKGTGNVFTLRAEHVSSYDL